MSRRTTNNSCWLTPLMTRLLSPPPLPLPSPTIICNFTPGTTPLQAALDDPSVTRIIIPGGGGGAGEYQYPTRPLTVRRSNLVIELCDGAVLQARRGFFHEPNDALLRLDGVSNVSIIGTGSAAIRMWRVDYANASLYTHAEWRHGHTLGRASPLQLGLR